MAKIVMVMVGYGHGDEEPATQGQVGNDWWDDLEQKRLDFGAEAVAQAVHDRLT